GSAVSLTISNNCSSTVWPAIVSNPNTPQLSVSGFTLEPNQSTTLQVNSFWSGRVWGRTNCTQDPFGKFTCATRDCNSSSIECFGKEGASPLTVAEFHMNHSRQGFDFFDITLWLVTVLVLLLEPQSIAVVESMLLANPANRVLTQKSSKTLVRVLVPLRTMMIGLAHLHALVLT
ncbi:hypothetical protein Tsubulata_010244, partial [Turnera subulata]